jgi:two-component sensor histidine kinase
LIKTGLLRGGREGKRPPIGELNHRVKNTLTTVQSIASQTLRNAPSLSHASDAIESRLIALSQVHNVLTDRSWAHVALHDIVAQVPPRVALPLAMALQELVTNAVKSGALSNGTGQIRIHWTLDGTSTPQHQHLTWEEANRAAGAEPRSPGLRARGSSSAAWLRNSRARCGSSFPRQASSARSTLHW